jgi:hypothetical protein
MRERTTEQPKYRVKMGCFLARRVQSKCIQNNNCTTTELYQNRFVGSDIYGLADSVSANCLAVNGEC